MRVAVIGGGSWGTTIASLLASRSDTVMWSRCPGVVAGVRESHYNSKYLGDLKLSPKLVATLDHQQAASQADVVVVAVPSHVLRGVMEGFVSHVRDDAFLVSLTKGLEAKTHLRASQVLAELYGNEVAVLSGPNLAREILSGQPAAAVMACGNSQAAQQLQELFSVENFRVYASVDVVGVEIAGAYKNVIALGVGITEGLGSGRNTQAALVTRGLAEMTRLGAAVGAQPETFAGLAGVGDLIATCFSSESRNRQVGEQIGKGRSLDEILSETPRVAEGVKMAEAAVELAKKYNLDLPIAEEVWAVISEQRTPQQAYRRLLCRPLKSESLGM